MRKSLSQRIYLRLTDAQRDDLESSDQSPAEKAAPRNFLLLLTARAASKVSDRLASPKTTLAWLLQSLGAPSLFIGLIAPLRESGSLIPQAFIGNYLRQWPIRKWAWTWGAIAQGACIAGCGAAALALEGAAAGLTITVLVALFALARGVSSVSAKDVLGKAIPKSKRGQLTGWATSLSGIIAIAAAIGLFFDFGSTESRSLYAIYLFIAAALWALGGLVHARIVESPGNTQTPENPMRDLVRKMYLLREDTGFRRFVIARSLAIGSGLSAPFVVSLSHDRLGGGSMWLGILIIADGLAAMLFAPAWGRWADRSSRQVLRFAMFATAILLAGVILTARFSPSLGWDRLLFPSLYFLLAVVHAGMRVGRKTYLVGMAKGNRRTDYVSLSNTLIGVVLLVAGGITALLALASQLYALMAFALAALLGALVARGLPSLRPSSN